MESDLDPYHSYKAYRVVGSSDKDEVVVYEFKESYGTKDGLAPGMKLNNALSVSIKGHTPPFLNFTASEYNSCKDLFLGVGTFGIMTPCYAVSAETFGSDEYYTQSKGVYTRAVSYNPNTEYYVLMDKVVVSESDGVYYPITWSVVVDADDHFLYANQSGSKNIIAVMEKLSADICKAPETWRSQLDNDLAIGLSDGLDVEYTVGLEWQFDETSKDTILGALSAESTNETAVKLQNDGTYKKPIEGVDYNLTFDLNIIIKISKTK